MSNTEFILLGAMTAITAFIGAALGTLVFGRGPTLGVGDSGLGPIRWVSLALGTGMVAIGLSADMTGLSPNPGIGVNQVALVIIGTAFLIATPFLPGGR